MAAFAVNAAHALLTAFVIAAAGEESMGLAASMLYGAGLGVSGMLFAAIAALFSQIFSSSRSAVGCSFLTLGVFYMLRAAGDVGEEWLSLASPFGLVMRSRFFVGTDPLPLLIALLEAAAVAAVALRLCAARDIERGFFPVKKGRAEAARSMRTSGALTLRLLRGQMIAWVFIMFALGASYGTVLGDIETFVAESEFYQMVIGVSDEYSTMEMFTATINSIGALICIVPLLMIVLRARSEEKEGRAENILARSVTREKYLAGYAASAFVTSVMLQFATALGLYAASASVLEEPISLTFLLKANMVFLPALWVMVGAAILLVGALPKASNAIWGCFAFAFFTEFIGRMLKLPEWLPKLTPFGHSPQLPVDGIEPAPLLAMTLLAAAMTVAGLVFFRRRDCG
jgi:ABC-2 type transport system permease protein